MSKKPKRVDLSKQLRRAFTESDLSMFALAKRSGVPYSGVHRFITGARTITLETASKLATVLALELQRRK